MTELIAQIREAEDNFKQMKEQRDLLYNALKDLRNLMQDDTRFRMQIHNIGDEFEAYKIFENCDKALRVVDGIDKSKE